MDKSEKTDAKRKRVLVLGGSGTIGRAAIRALARNGHEVVCFLRPGKQSDMPEDSGLSAGTGTPADVRFGDITNADSLERDGIRGERFDALLSCMASRTGAPADAWAIDFQAHLNALTAAQNCGIPHMVQLSAICVQKPMLAFQHAKLAFEEKLRGSGLDYSIVRPTAFFKSLSGQVGRVMRGKPFLVFGDGRLTACKPIDADDLGDYLVRCIEDPGLRNRILPIGGPGKAITPHEQGEQLFAALGRKPRFRQVPVAMLDGIIRACDISGRIFPAMRDRAEFARIGRYYATESMLVLDPETGRYAAEATPSYGSRTLFDYYARLSKGQITDERGDHAVF